MATKSTTTTSTATSTRTPKGTPGWVRAVRWAFFVGTIAFLVGILAQAYFAGAFLFGGSTPDTHIGLGWPLAHMLGPIVLILSALSRIGLKLHILAAASFVIAAVVPILATMAVDAPGVAALHPLSAVVTFGLLFYVAMKVWPIVAANPMDTATASTATPAKA